MESRRGTVLVVDDEDIAHRLVKRHFQGWTVASAYSVAQAKETLAGIDDLRLSFIDLNLPDSRFDPKDLDGSVFALTAYVRRGWPRIPAIVFTGHIDGNLVNAAQRLDAEYMFKQSCHENLMLTERRLSHGSLAGDWKRGKLAVRLADAHGLTPAESSVLAVALSGGTNAQIAAALGIEEATVKTHVRRILRKAGFERMRELRASVMLPA